MTDAEPHSPRRRRLVQRLALGVAVLVALRVLLPFALARGGEWALRRNLRLPASIENVDLVLTRGRLAIEGFLLGPAADLDPVPEETDDFLARWQRVAVDLSWWDLVQGRIRVEDFELIAPRVRLERDAEGRIEPLPPAPPEETAEAEEPPAEQSAAEEEGGGWPVRVDRFALIDPDLSLMDEPSGEELLDFGLAELELLAISLTDEGISLGGISISEPVIRMQRRLAFGDEAAAPAREEPAPEAAAAEGEGGSAAGYHIDRIDIGNAEFSLLTSQGPLHVSLGLTAERVTLDPDTTFPVDLQLGVEDGTFRAHGDLGLRPVSWDGKITYTNMPVPPLWLAMNPELTAWLQSCRASAELDVKLEPVGEASMRAVVGGTASISDLRLEDPARQEVALGWKALTVEAKEIRIPVGPEAGRQTLALARVTLSEPDIRYTNGTTAFDNLLLAPSDASVAPEPAEAAEPAAATPPPELTIDTLELRGGNLAFVDPTVTPATTTRVKGLRVDGSAVAFPERHGSLRIGGRVEEAPFNLRGGLNGDRGDFTLALDRLSLPHFDPYAQPAGWELRRGEVTLESQIKLRGASYALDNDVVLHQLDVATRKDAEVSGALGVGVDFALALLRDPSGDISLTAPVELGEGQARAAIGTIVVKALTEAVQGALASPLKLAGMAFGGKGGGPVAEPLDMAPGETALTDEAAERVPPLVTLLEQRPQIALRLHGRAGAEDQPALAETILAERVVAGDDLPDLEDTSFFARRRVRQALEKRARGEAVSLEPEDQVLLGRYVAATRVPKARFEALAQRRAEAVRALLVQEHGVDPARLSADVDAATTAPGVAYTLGAI